MRCLQRMSYSREICAWTRSEQLLTKEPTYGKQHVLSLPEPDNGMRKFLPHRRSSCTFGVETGGLHMSQASAPMYYIEANLCWGMQCPPFP
mmetsp:Transcript_33608/g.61843  ORF Transcript_33608/g.61843 Transcript_33608/m.61843 type:complete len:91 (-) Transcript_33608:204-476(-)